MRAGVLFDVDGTLVDTNYLHVVAWSDAFRACGHRVPMRTLHELIGQGSDRLVESVLGHPDDAIVAAHADMYGPRLHRLQAFDGAQQLLRRTKAEGLVNVLATSASSHDVTHLRAVIGADDVIDHVTTRDDAASSKPAPDIVDQALQATGLEPTHCLFVGDSVWDVEAASRAAVGCICVLTGGISEQSLLRAGALEVYPDVKTLLDDFERSLLGGLVACARP